MPRTPFTFALLTGLALCLVACGDRSERFEEGVAVMAPAAFDSKLLLIDNHNEEGHLLDVGASEVPAATERVSVPPNITRVVPREGDHDELLLLSAGRQGSASLAFEPAVLAAMKDDGSQRAYDLGNPFDQMVQSEDGRFVFLWRSGNNGRLLDAGTQVAIVDLDAPADSGATIQSLTNLGETPRQVVFSPPMDIAGETRRLAVIFGGRKLSLLDLGHPSRRDTAVELTSDLNRQVRPEQVLFDPNEPRIFVRASGASDIYALRLLGPFDNPGGNDFRPNLDLLGAGSRPGQMTLVDRGDRVQLLIADGDRAELTLIALDTGRTQHVPLPFQTGQLYVTDVVNDDGAAVATAMLWNGWGNRVLFAGLDDLESRGDRALETSSVMPEAVANVMPLPDGERVVVTHQNQGMSIVDIANRTLTPLTSNIPLTSATIDLDRKRVWVAPQGQSGVAFLDLETGATREILLDAPVLHFVPMLATGRLAVMHDNRLGHLTVIEADDPARDTAQAVRGFLFADLLD